MKKVLLFILSFFVLVGCNSSKGADEERPTVIKTENLEEEKILQEDSQNVKVVDVSEYNYKVPEALIIQNNKELFNIFDEIKKDFFQENITEYISQNGKFSVMPYEAGYNKEEKWLLIIVLFVNTSGREINNIDVNFDIHLKGRSFSKITDTSIKITKKDTGGIPPNTIMPYAIRYDDLDLDIETENFSSTDMEGSNMKNIVIRYEK